MKNRFAATSQQIWYLTIRNLKIFFKNRTGVICSFIAPLVVLLLFLLFLREYQIDGVKELLPKDLEIDENGLSNFINSSLVSSVIAISIITVPLSSSLCIINDKINKINYDFIISPVKKSTIVFGYFISIFFSSMLVILILFLIGEIFVWSVGGEWLSLIKFFELLGVTVLSVISTTFVVMFISSLINSTMVFTTLNAIAGTILGFIMGCYVPTGEFPTAVQIISNIWSCSSTSCLIREIVMSDALISFVQNTLPNTPELWDYTYNLIGNGYFQLNVVGFTWETWEMYLYISGVGILFLGLNLYAFSKLKLV